MNTETDAGKTVFMETSAGEKPPYNTLCPLNMMTRFSNGNVSLMDREKKKERKENSGKKCLNSYHSLPLNLILVLAQPMMK